MAKDALPSVLYRTIGKKFTEYRSDTRQSKVAVTEEAAISVQFAECRPPDTQQNGAVCRVSRQKHSAK